MSETTTEAPETVAVAHLLDHRDEEVRLRGWLENKRSSGKIAFLQVRDGSGTVQCVASKKELPEAAWAAVEAAGQESTIEATGRVHADERAPGGVEVHLGSFRLLYGTEDYPITPKEHGTAFLMEHRHLWLRSSRQRAVLKVRSEVEQGIRDFYYEREFVLIDSPILTPAACEGTSTLFETDYFGDPAYLTQSGQLYLEPAAAAFGKVYCFGPTFRAEKSKTRRHLMEFWMVEPEVAFLEFDGLCELAEEFVAYLAARVLERCRGELAVLERDVSKLEAVTAPFPRITYTEAIERLRAEGVEKEWGEDFGGEDETVLAEPLRPAGPGHPLPGEGQGLLHAARPGESGASPWRSTCSPRRATARSSAAASASTTTTCCCVASASTTCRSRRSSGTSTSAATAAFRHSGFGMGIERFVAWMCGVPHLRETIPYPRMLYKIYP